MKHPRSGKVHRGENITMGTGCVIGEDGFHFTRKDDGTLEFGDHKFGVILGDNLWLGSHITIDAGRWRDTVVNGGSVLDNGVHVSHNVIIGKNCIICAKAILCGSCEIGDNTEIWAGAIIHQGIKVGKGCAVGAGTYLRHDLEDNMVAYVDQKTGKLVVKPKSETKRYNSKNRGGVVKKRVKFSKQAD